MAGFDTTGFVQIKIPKESRSDLFTEDDLLNIKINQEKETSEVFNCNISFSAFGELKTTLPNLRTFFTSDSGPNLTLFQKADEFSLEISKINDTLIGIIKDMDCCDASEKYNQTMVPFFRFFAGDPNPNNDTFMEALISTAEVITSIKSTIDPLICLIAPLPGNPWVDFNADYLTEARVYSRKTERFLENIMSGELIDIMLNPIKDIRKKLESCSGVKENTSYDFISERTDFQNIVKLINSNQGIISHLVLPEPKKPKKPDQVDFKSGESYSMAVDNYNISIIKYKNDYNLWIEMSQEHLQKENSREVFDSTFLRRVKIKEIRDNSKVCDCLLDALDIHPTRPKFQKINLSEDFDHVVNKFIIHNDQKLKYSSSELTDNVKQDLLKGSKTYNVLSFDTFSKSYPHPYKDIISTSDIKVDSFDIQSDEETAEGFTIMKYNHSLLKKRLQKLQEYNNLDNQLNTLVKLDKEIWNGYRFKAELLAKNQDEQDLFTSFFSSWVAFDPNDLTDSIIRNQYIQDTDFSSFILDSTSSDIIRANAKNKTIEYSTVIKRSGDIRWRSNNPLGLTETETSGYMDTLNTSEFKKGSGVIFANSNLGFNAGIQYIKENPENILQLDNFQSMLEKSGNNLNITSNELINLPNNQLIQLIKTIADSSPDGYKPGQTVQKTAPRLTNLGIIPEDSSQDINNIISINGLITEYIEERAQTFGVFLNVFYSMEQVGEFIYWIDKTIDNNVAGEITILIPIEVPCSCEDFLCQLLQTIVSYIITVFEELVQYLAELIIKFMLPDWIRNLIALVLTKIKCLVDLANLPETLETVSKATEELLLRIQHRVSLFPEDICWIKPTTNRLSGLGDSLNLTDEQRQEYFPEEEFSNEEEVINNNPELINNYSSIDSDYTSDNLVVEIPYTWKPPKFDPNFDSNPSTDGAGGAGRASGDRLGRINLEIIATDAVYIRNPEPNATIPTLEFRCE